MRAPRFLPKWSLLWLGLFLLVGGTILAAGFSFLGPTQAAAQSQSVLAVSSAEPLASSAPRLRELSALRTATAKTFELADGKRELVIYAEPVHYKDASGVFREIDNRIVSDARQIDGTAYAFRNGANTYSANWGAEAADPYLVRIEYRGTVLSFGPVGAAPAAARLGVPESRTLRDLTYEENLLRYAEVFPGVGLLYQFLQILGCGPLTME